MSGKPKPKIFFFPFLIPKPGKLTDEEKKKQSEDIKQSLFRSDHALYDPQQYSEHLLEQYKVAVQMADNISERRGQANKFFMSVCSTLIVVGAIVSGNLNVLGATLWVWLIMGVGYFLTYYWYRIIESYDQLNTGKFLVIHQMEAKLPASLYDGEWDALGRGENPNLYRPFTRTEKLIPRLFAYFFILVAVAILIYGIWSGAWMEPFNVTFSGPISATGVNY